jgi:hypothetical protein
MGVDNVLSEGRISSLCSRLVSGRMRSFRKNFEVEQMNWDALGAIAELGGAVSVLGTLIYLAKQINNNSKLLSTTIHDSAMQGYTSINQWSISDPEIAALTRRIFVEDESETTPLDKFRVEMILRIFANHLLKLCHLFKDGVYPANEWRNAGLETKQVFSSTQIGGEFMRDNHLFDELWLALSELGDEKMSRFE